MDIRVQEVRPFNPSSARETARMVFFLDVRYGHWKWKVARSYEELQLLHVQVSKILKKDVLPSLPEAEADTDTLRANVTSYFGDLSPLSQVEKALHTFIGRTTATAECLALEKEVSAQGFVQIKGPEDERLNGVVRLYGMAIEDTLYYFEKQVVGTPCDLPVGSFSVREGQVSGQGSEVSVQTSGSTYHLRCASEAEGQQWRTALHAGTQQQARQEEETSEALSPVQQRKVALLCEKFPEADSQELLRFLQGNQWHEEVAAGKYAAHLQWKKDVRIDELTINEVWPQLQTGRIVYTGKKDKRGRPIVLFRARLHSPSIDFMDTMLVGMYLIKRCAEDAGDGQFVIINDLSGFEKANNDFRMMKLMVELALAQYPNRVGAIWSTSTPWLFRMIFRVVKPWLGDDLLSRVHLFGGTSEIKDFVDPDQLPEDVGGTATVDMRAWAEERARLEGVSLDTPATHQFGNEEIVAAFSDAPVSHTAQGCRHQGWMKKQGGFVKKFNKRYCVLKGPILYYYRAEDDPKADGVVFLRGATLTHDPTSATFHILTHGRKDCVFQLLDKKQRDWLQVLEEVILLHDGQVGTASEASDGASSVSDPVDAYGLGWSLTSSKAKKKGKGDAPDTTHLDALFALFHDSALREFAHGHVPGRDIIQALERAGVERGEALRMAQGWVAQYVLFPLGGKKDFDDTEGATYMFTFTSSTPVLNLLHISATPSGESADALLQALHSQLVALLQAHLRPDGGVDREAVRASRGYFDFVRATGALQHVEVEALADKATFYFNLRSLLLLHAQVHHGLGTCCEERFALLTVAQYQVGEYRLSVSDLGHGLLRANQSPPESLLSKHFFEKKDIRPKLALKSSDERVVVAWPGLTLDPFHYSNKYEQTLAEAADAFASKLVTLKEKEKEVWVSVILTWVNEGNKLLWLEQFLKGKSLQGTRVILENIDWTRLGMGGLSQ